MAHLIDGPDDTYEDHESDVQKEKKEEKSSETVKHHINSIPPKSEISVKDHNYVDPYDDKDDWNGK